VRQTDRRTGGEQCIHFRLKITRYISLTFIVDIFVRTVTAVNDRWRCRRRYVSASVPASRSAWWPETMSTRPGRLPPSAASSNPVKTSSFSKVESLMPGYATLPTDRSVKPYLLVSVVNAAFFLCVMNHRSRIRILRIFLILKI